jgi:transcriptional regulator with XRE-family HTH domain
MNVNERIKKMMKERDWTEYRLAVESGLSQSTIANLFRRNTVPSVMTIEAICEGFGISLAQFFAEDDLVELSDEQRRIFDKWLSLTVKQKKLIEDLINVINEDR